MAPAIQTKKEIDMEKILSAAVWIIFLAPLIYLLIIWQNLPAKVPMHYNLNGVIDRYGDKSELLLMALIITGVNIGTYLFLSNVHRIGPKRNGLENKDRMQRMAFVISVFQASLLCVIIYSSAIASIELVPGVVLSGVGLLLSFIGNYMYNIKPNYFAGLRLPWTLENEDNWRKTHHLGGKLWFIGGLLITIICLFLPFKTGIIVFFIIIAILIIIPAVYSYNLHKQQKNFH
jgi:uncharacterized membrane protein